MKQRPTIGLLLCRAKNKVVVEYALRNLRKPIGVAQWETNIVRSLPKELQGSLPSIEEIENELSEIPDIKPEKRGAAQDRTVERVKQIAPGTDKKNRKGRLRYYNVTIIVEQRLKGETSCY